MCVSTYFHILLYIYYILQILHFYLKRKEKLICPLGRLRPQCPGTIILQGRRFSYIWLGVFTWPCPLRWLPLASPKLTEAVFLVNTAGQSSSRWGLCIGVISVPSRQTPSSSAKQQHGTGEPQGPVGLWRSACFSPSRMGLQSGHHPGGRAEASLRKDSCLLPFPLNSWTKSPLPQGPDKGDGPVGRVD